MPQIEAFATDLDGTLIPLDEASKHFDALREIESIVDEHRLRMLFVTGRSFELTQQALKTYRLPTPDAILCDVGTRLMFRTADGEYQHSDEFHNHLVDLRGTWTNRRIREEVKRRDLPVTPQAEENHTEVKCSFDFNADRFDEVQRRVSDWISSDNVPLKMTISVDPFTGGGLLDLLPSGADKAFGLNWWGQSQGLDSQSVIFAGDSGNDTAAITGGPLAIVVGNAAESLVRAAREHHQGRKTLFLADCTATEGVLQGLRFFLERDRVARGQGSPAGGESPQ